MRMATGIFLAFLWMAVVLLASAWIAPYWNALFADSFASIPAGIALGMGFYVIGAQAAVSWGFGD